MPLWHKNQAFKEFDILIIKIVDYYQGSNINLSDTNDNNIRHLSKFAYYLSNKNSFSSLEKAC
jgi:hypothetical protein